MNRSYFSKRFTVLAIGSSFFLSGWVAAQDTNRRAFQVPERSNRTQSGSQNESSTFTTNTPSNSITSSTPSFAQDREQPTIGVMGEATSEYVDLHYCFAELIEDVEIPAKESGVLTAIMVKEGDAIVSKQVLALMDDERAAMAKEEYQLNFDKATNLATDQNEILAAQRKLSLMQAEFTRAQRLRSKGSESEFNYQRTLYQKEIAEIEVQTARNKQMLASLDAKAQAVGVRAAMATIERHKIKSTLNGNVFEKLKDTGEYVQAGETILRIGRMDKLQITGQVDSKLLNPTEIEGCRATAFVELAGGESVAFDGQVSFVSLETNADTFGIKVEIDNRKYQGSDRWILNVGAEMNVRVHFNRPIQRLARNQ